MMESKKKPRGRAGMFLFAPPPGLKPFTPVLGGSAPCLSGSEDLHPFGLEGSVVPRGCAQTREITRTCGLLLARRSLGCQTSPYV